MSYEIRTPLNAIIGMSDLLAEEGARSFERRHVEVIRAASQGLLALVDDLLDLTRLESGRLGFESSVFNLREFVEATFSNAAAIAHKNGIETILEIDCSTPLQIRADRKRLQQVLDNVLLASVDATGEKQLYMRVWYSNRLCFAICRNCSHLRDRFETLRDTSLPSYELAGHIGMGLALSKALIQFMGGHIHSNLLSKGALFAFSLPAIAVESSPAVNSRSPLADSGLRALVLDKNSQAGLVTALYLQEMGLQVTTASDPNELVLNPVAVYDIVFVDYDTAGPKLHSFLSARQGAREEKPHLVVMQKSNVADWPRPKRTSSGSQLLLKPVTRTNLLEALHHLFIERDKTSHFHDFGYAGTNRDFRILVVDDCKDNRYLMKAILKGKFSELWFADNGRAAVELLQKNSFDLVFMDLEMPEMDGITATQVIRAHERHEKINPCLIYALTAHVLVEEKLRALRAGCDEYITKPVTRAVVLDAVERARNCRVV